MIMGKDYERYREKKIASKMFIEFVGDKEDYKRLPYVHITDVQMSNANCGDGSITMHALIKLVKQMNATKITGGLSSEDEDHSERRDHFYTKFGFTIDGNKLELRSDCFDDALRVN